MKEIQFASNLKELRESHNMTQHQLAELTHVNQRTISAWEKGICEPSFTNLARLCEIFGEDFNGLLTKKDE